MEAAIAAQMAMTQQTVALSMLKQAAQQQQQVAEILLQSVATVPTGSLGGLVDIAA